MSYKSEPHGSTASSGNTGPLLLTAAQVAQLLQIAPRTLWRLLSKGAIVEPVHIGGATRWRREEVLAWLDAGCPALDSSKNNHRR